VDLFIAGGSPLDEQNRRRRRSRVGESGSDLYVHRPEDILLQKLRWFRRGQEVQIDSGEMCLAFSSSRGNRSITTISVAAAEILDVLDLLDRALRA